MIKFTILPLLVSLALVLPIAAQAGEKATYVGGGRYVGEGKSVPDAIIRQRSNEYSERENDRRNAQRDYDRDQRRDRDDGYDRAERDDY
ncbi:MAG: hypothetical protein ABI167_10275 [Nitrosospira sp.]